MERDNLDFLLAHTLFFITCIIILMIPIIQIGPKLLILVIMYNILIPIIGLYRKHHEWVHMWLFSFFISIFQVFPDWFLSAELNVLVFPEDGLFKLGSVSSYMIGLWAIPLFIIIFVGSKINNLKSKRLAYFSVAILSFLIFSVAELSMWALPSWYPQNVTLIFEHIALYIIIPEILLGLSSYYYNNKFKSSKILIKIFASFITMIIYLGSISFFYFLIEKIIVGSL